MGRGASANVASSRAGFRELKPRPAMPDDELTPEQRFALEDEAVAVPRALARGQSREEVIADLVRQRDWSPAAAARYVDEFIAELARYHASPEARRDLVRHYRLRMIGGLLMLLVGLLFTTAMVVFALAGAPVVIMTGGLIVLGLAVFFDSAGRWRRYRRSDPAS